MTLHIMLVDDHTVVRKGTRELLEGDPNISVTAEAGSAEEALVLLKESQPDLMLIDINIPGENGLVLTEMVKNRYGRIRIIVFSAFNDTQYIQKAQALRADGYVTKTVDQQTLLKLIWQVVRGETPVFSEDVQEKLQHHNRFSNSSLLSARETEILMLVAMGKTNQVIAKELILAVRTVDTHVANIMKKLGMNNRTQLSHYAYENKLL